MKRFLILALVLGAAPARAQAAADSAAIRTTIQHYMQGWYTGDSARMAKALHPRLVKRMVDYSNGATVLDEMSAAQLVRMTASGGGTRTAASQRRAEVKILDIFGTVATARGDMKGWMDYFQLAKWDGQWVIVNVLWANR